MSYTVTVLRNGFEPVAYGPVATSELAEAAGQRLSGEMDRFVVAWLNPVPFAPGEFEASQRETVSEIADVYAREAP